MVDDHSHDFRARPIFQYNRRWCGADRAAFAIAGFVMDRIGRKWCTVPSTGLPALAFVLIPMTRSFTQLAVLVGFAAIAQGLALGSVATSTYDVVPAHVRGRLQAARRSLFTPRA
jgi:MFS family permease